MSTSILIAKDLLSGIAPAAAGDGYIVDISAGRSYSIQLVVTSPSSPGSCTVTLSSSNDKVNWVAGTPVAVTIATTAFMTNPTNFAKYIKVSKAISSGSVVIKANLVVVGDRS